MPETERLTALMVERGFVWQTDADVFTALLTRLEQASPERVPVPTLWRDLNLSPYSLASYLSAWRDALPACGVMLHAATVSQVGGKGAARLSLNVCGRYVASLSVPPKDSTALHTIKKFIGLLTLPELVALQSHLADAVAAHTSAVNGLPDQETRRLTASSHLTE